MTIIAKTTISARHAATILETVLGAPAAEQLDFTVSYVRKNAAATDRSRIHVILVMVTHLQEPLLQLQPASRQRGGENRDFDEYRAARFADESLRYRWETKASLQQVPLLNLPIHYIPRQFEK